MEITKREIIASISILAIMLIFGILIGESIGDYHSDQMSVYNKALKIKDEELFEYAMNTNVGNAFIEGELKALDTVSYPEIPGEYMYVEKIEERYTMHTRTVTTTDSKGKTRTKTETYWTWDKVGSEEKTCENVSLLGIEFPSSKFRLPSSSYIDTQKVSSNTRYKYYGTPISHHVVSFVSLKEGTINDKRVTFEPYSSIEDVMKANNFNIWLYVFWVAWILLSAFLVYNFCLLENDWLNLDYVRKKRGL